MRILLFTVLLFLVHNLTSQVIFFNSLDQARAFALEQGKGTFIKICTDSNRKCRKIDEEVFQDEAVADILNMNFANVRIDPNVEQTLVKSLKIKSVPTLIFIDKEGQEFDRLTGYKDAAETIKIIKSAARKVSDINDLRKAYFSNKRDNVLLKEYYNALISGGFNADARRLLPQYFSNLPELIPSEENEFILNSSDHHRSRSFQHVLENIILFDTLFGPVEVNKTLVNAFYNDLHPKDAEDLLYVERRMKSVFRGHDVERFYDHLVVTKYKEELADSELVEDYCRSGLNVVRRMNCQDMDYINELIVDLMLKKQQNEFIESLRDELDPCFQQTRNIASIDLLSVLEYKLGNKERAIKLVQEATRLSFEDQKKFASSLPYFKKIGFIE